MSSVLPSAAAQASKAAFASALAEAEKKTNGDESLEPGEIQEVDMQAQAETIRTVFSDPTNFNVKVSTWHAGYPKRTSDANGPFIPCVYLSILCTPLGLSGLTRRRRRVAIYPRPP